MSRSTYAELEARGCLCGTADRAAECPIHGPNDLRGLRAYYEAGMPLAFPATATCARCGAEGLMYPDVALDDPSTPGPPASRPTLVCPTCSTPQAEHVLILEVLASGLHKLNGRRVFA